MKVCYVAADVTIPGIMGGSTHTFELARNLVKLGHEAFVVCRREHGQRSYELQDGVHLHRIYRGMIIPTKRVRWKGTRKFNLKQHVYHAYLHTGFFILAGYVVTKLVKFHNADVILERGTSSGEGALASIITGRSLVLEVISPHYSSLSFKKAEKILVYSRGALQKVPENKVEVVTAGVNIDLFSTNIDGSWVRTRYGLNDLPLIGYAGSFAPWHGVENLLYAMKHVIRCKPKSKLMLIGPYPKEIAHLINELGLKEHVVLTGPVSYDSVASYLAACNILVAPYSPRQWGKLYSYIKIFEYMAMGKPIITTNIIPDAKIIQEKEAGLLIQPDNPLRLSEAIVKILTSEDLASRLAQNARQIAIEHSWFAYAKRLVNLFENVLKT